jgi:putative flippase GtrA
MRSNREIAKEALRRTFENRERKRRREERMKFTGLTAACILLICIVSVFVFQSGLDLTGQQAQASITLLGDAVVGGYVLAGVIGFTAGAILVNFIVRRSRQQERQRK